VAIVRVTIVLGGNCSGDNCPRWQLSQVAIVAGSNFPGWQLSRVAIVLGGNCPGGNFPGWQLSGWQLSRVAIVQGGNYPRWQLFGWQLSRVAIVWVAIVRVTIVPGGNCLGGNCPPGGNCPRTVTFTYRYCQSFSICPVWILKLPCRAVADCPAKCVDGHKGHIGPYVPATNSKSKVCQHTLCIRRPSLAQPTGPVWDGRPQGIKYRWAWQDPEAPSKSCPIYDTFRPTMVY
jgi:hypothetical protein